MQFATRNVSCHVPSQLIDVIVVAVYLHSFAALQWQRVRGVPPHVLSAAENYAIIERTGQHALGYICVRVWMRNYKI